MNRVFNINENTTHTDLLERVIEGLVALTLLFLPLAFGTVERWSEQVFIVLASVLSLLAVVRWMMVPQIRFVRSWIYVPLALMLALVGVQLLSLPSGLLAQVASHTAAVKQQYLADLPNADTVLSRMSLSFYPQATVHNLRLILAVSAFLIVILNTYRRPGQVKRLLTTVALIGGGIALIAIFQVISQTNKIYWLVPVGHRLADAGPFVNHSNFAQFMNLCMGAAIARMLVELQEQLFVLPDLSVQDVAEFLGTSRGALFWFLAASVIMGMVSIFLSLSRGGMISLLIAGSFTTLIITYKQGTAQGRGKLIAVMALIAFVCILYIGFDAVYDRLESLHEVDKAEGGRWGIVKDIALAWTRFPLFGTGLGTHEVVYPMFDRSTIPALAGHAENEYAQALEETGLIGFVLLLSIITITWLAYAKTIRRIKAPIQMAAFGLGYGLLAIMIHSLSDFGQHLPANSVLTATFVALLIILAKQSESDRHTVPQSAATIVTPSHTRTVTLSTGVILLTAWAAISFWSIAGANSARRAQAHWNTASQLEAQLTEANWQGTDVQYVNLLTEAKAAADMQPQNIQYQHWLNVYRWQAISRTIDPNTGAVILLPETLAFTQQIIDELHQARILCPTYGQTLCVIGQLEQLVLDDPNGIERIQQGYELAPCDAITCYLAGTVDAEQGRRDSAQAKFQRAIQLKPQLYETIARYCTYQLGDSDLALVLSEDAIGRLNILARILSEIEEENQLAHEIRTQICQQIKTACEQNDAAPGTFASLAYLQRREGEKEAAIESYRQALMRNYNNIGWRYDLAQLLADTGQIKDAIHEARICLRLKTDYDRAKKLIAELSVQDTMPQ